MAKLVSLDFDGTLTEHRGSWELLNHLYGTAAAGKRKTKQYEREEISFEEWCEGHVTDWQEHGVTRHHIKRAATAVKLKPGIETLFARLRDLDTDYGVLSGGIENLVYHIDRFDPDFVIANEIQYDTTAPSRSQHKPTQVNVRVGPNQKGERIKELASERGISLKEVIHVGDSHTDVEAFEAVGNAILFDPDDRFPPESLQHVDAHVESRNLERVAELL